MRLNWLALERYGPFTGPVLRFRRDARLHIVYGPNEAGKSCALAAVTDLLFGIEARTRFDFLHQGKDLRISAEVENRGGDSLAFKRRKGTKNTLSTAEDKPLAEEALAPFRGGLTREVFCRAFGLNAKSLRDGAEEMLTSKGDVGATLLAAASGLRGLTELRRTLETEADGIFAPRASKDRRFYQATERFEEARRAIRESELKAGDWKALHTRIDELAARMGDLGARRDACAVENSRISRLKRLAPLVALINADRDALSQLGELPGVPAGFAARLRVSLDAARHERQNLLRAKTDEDIVSREHSSVAVDEELLAASADVQLLFAETGAYTAERRDLPRIRSEEEALQAELQALAVRLGLGSPDEVEAEQPTDSAKSLLKELGREGRRIRTELESGRKQLRDEQLDLGILRREQATRGALTDPKPLRDRLAALAPVLALAGKAADLRSANTKEEKRLAEAALRLRPSVADLDALAIASLPPAETVSGLRAALDGVAENTRRTEERVAAANEAARAAEARLHPLTLAGPIPSPKAIAALRAERDGRWMGLRATLVGAADSLSGADLAAAIADFERLTSDADRLADQAAGDAKRVADYANETRILAEERRRADEAQLILANLQAASAEALAGWAELWAQVTIVPLAPAEMLTWLTGVANLIERRDLLQSSRQDLATHDAAIASIGPALHALAEELGLHSLDGLDPALTAARVETRLDDLNTAWGAARDLDTRLRDTQDRVERLGGEIGEVERREEEWLARWRPALKAAGFGADLTPEQTEAVIQVWDEVPAALRERANRRARVIGMQRNVDRFEAEAGRLIAELSDDLSGLPVDAGLKALNERLLAAGQDEARRSEAAKRLADARRTTAGADRALAEADAALARLAADLPEDADLESLCERLARRDELLKAISEKRSQFAIQAEGLEEDAVRAELASFDRDEAEAALTRLAEEQRGLSSLVNEVFADHRDAEKQRQALEHGVGAEIAVQQRRNAEAELASAAREWAVLRIAALLLGEAMESHRAGQQDPLMTRAGHLFATVTGGAFTGFVQDYDDNDVPRIAGRRPSGDTVPMDGLSEGTRDQLYLALRLAYLEDYARAAEPAPFVGDDLFATFDDRRTAAGLSALAAVADHVQPILFTHHRHVADAAMATLGKDAEVLELG